MRKGGIIEADVSIVSPSITGSALTAVIGVTLDREDTAILEEFKRRVRAAREVTQCYFVTGEADFILIVSVGGMSEFEDFARRVLTEDQCVKRYVTNVVISEVKSATRMSTVEDARRMS